MAFDITAFPVRPSNSLAINWGHSLAGGLIYASSYGIPRGWGVSTVPGQPAQFTARNLVSHRPGQLNGAPANTNFSQGIPSGCIESPNIDVEYPNVGGASLESQCSLFVVARDFSFNGDRVVFGWKETIAATDVGICLHTTGPNAWGCSVSNGATQQRTNSDPGTRIQNTWQSVCASYNSGGEFFNFYVSGTASPATSPVGTITGTLGVPTRGRVFQAPYFDNGQVAVAYFWKRALSRVQVMQLHADPFLLMRPKEQTQAFSLGRMTRPMA